MSGSDRGPIFRFVASFALTCAVGGGLILAVAVVANIGNFGIEAQDKDERLPDPLYESERLSALWFMNAAKASTTPVWIIGTSISMRGFDTCSLDGFSNFSRPGQTIADVLNWLPEALRSNSRVRHVFIEVSAEAGGLEAGVGIDLHHGRFWPNLSFELAVKSLEALLSGNSVVHCVPPPLERRHDLMPWTPHMQAGQTQAALNKMLGAMAPWCAASPQNQVVLFLPPWFREPELPPRIGETLRNFRTEVKREARALRSLVPECAVTVYEMQPPDGYALEQWMDFRHFGPALGRRMLRRMLTEPGTATPAARTLDALRSERRS